MEYPDVNEHMLALECENKNKNQKDTQWSAYSDMGIRPPVVSTLIRPPCISPYIEDPYYNPDHSHHYSIYFWSN